MAPKRRRGPARAPAADVLGDDRGVIYSRARPDCQILDPEGYRLSVRRSPVVGEKRLTRPSLWHLAVDRWREVAP
jgi:hypothetical protein